MMTQPDFLCSDGACLPEKGDVRVGKDDTSPRMSIGFLGLFNVGHYGHCFLVADELATVRD